MNIKLKLMCQVASCISAKKFIKLDELIIECKNNSISGQLVYETILQTYLFNGFPAAISGLQIFRKIYTNSKNIISEIYDDKIFRESGLDNITKVYSKKTSKLLNSILELSPDLKEWMIIEGYGKVKGRKWIPLKDRELLNVAMLSTNYYHDQLMAHIRGSIYTGNSEKDILTVINSTSRYNSKSNIKNALKLAEKVFKSTRLNVI